MNATHDRELQQWVDAWQAVGESPADEVQRRVRHRVWLLRMWAAGEAVVALAALVVVSYRAIVEPDPFERVAMMLLGVIAVSGLALSHWHWRGLWRASADTTAAFLSRSADRARRLQRYIHAGWFILAAEVAVFVPWIDHRLQNQAGGDATTALFAWTFLGTLVGTAVVALLVAERWIRRERATLADVRRELDQTS